MEVAPRKSQLLVLLCEPEAALPISDRFLKERKTKNKKIKKSRSERVREIRNPKVCLDDFIILYRWNFPLCHVTNLVRDVISICFTINPMSDSENRSFLLFLRCMGVLSFLIETLLLNWNFGDKRLDWFNLDLHNLRLPAWELPN